MKDQFIVLSKTDSGPIIVNVANIVLVEGLEKGKGSIVTLNFADSGGIKFLYVDESFIDIKTQIGSATSLDDIRY